MIFYFQPLVFDRFSSVVALYFAFYHSVSTMYVGG